MTVPGESVNDGADQPMRDALPTTPPALDRHLPADVQGEVEQAYRDYASSLLRFVRRRVACNGLSEAQVDTEGVVHDTFAAAAQHWKGIADPPAWLFTVARRRVDRAGARFDGNSLSPDALATWEDSRDWSSISPRATWEDDFYARQIVAAIGRLPTRQRAATYLRHVHGWPLAEIADLLSCAPATAAVHVHRGTTKIRDQIFVDMDRRWVRHFSAPSFEWTVAWGMSVLQAARYTTPLRTVVVRAGRRVLALGLLVTVTWLVFPWPVARWALLALGVLGAFRACAWLLALAREIRWRMALTIAIRRHPRANLEGAAGR